jgi:hypothetical protein
VALLFATAVQAQSAAAPDVDGPLDEMFEERAPSGDVLLAGFGDWRYWQQNPVNPCQASKELLANLPALSAEEAEEVWRQVQNARDKCSVKYLIQHLSLPSSTISALLPLLHDGIERTVVRSSRLRLSSAFASRQAVEPPLLLRAETFGPHHLSAAVTFSWHRFSLQKVTYSLRDDALEAAPARHDFGIERLHLQMPLGPLLVGVGDFSMRLAEGLVIATSRANGEDSLSGDPGIVEALGTSARCATDHQLPASAACGLSSQAVADFELRPSLRGLFLLLPSTVRRSWSALLFASHQTVDVQLNDLVEGRSCELDETSCRAPRFFIAPSSAPLTPVGPKVVLPNLLRASLFGLRLKYQIAEGIWVGATTTASQATLIQTPLQLRLSGADPYAPAGLSTVAAVDFHAQRGHWSSASEVAMSVDWWQPLPEPQVATSTRLARRAERFSLEFEAWYVAARYHSTHAHPRVFSYGARTSSWRNHRGARMRLAVARPKGTRFSTHLAVSAPLAAESPGPASALSFGFQWLFRHNQVLEPSLAASAGVAERPGLECTDLSALDGGGCANGRLQLTSRLAVNPRFARWFQLQVEARLSTRLSADLSVSPALVALVSHVNLSFGRRLELTLSARYLQGLKSDNLGQRWNLAAKLNVRPKGGLQLGLHYRSGELLSDDEQALRHRMVLNVEWMF